MRVKLWAGAYSLRSDPYFLMFKESAGSLFVSGVCSVQWAANCAVSGRPTVLSVGPSRLAHIFSVMPDLIHMSYRT